MVASKIYVWRFPGVFQFFACKYCYAGRFLLRRNDKLENICWTMVLMLNNCSTTEHTFVVCHADKGGICSTLPTCERLKYTPLSSRHQTLENSLYFTHKPCVWKWNSYPLFFALILDKLRYMDEAELKLAYVKLFRKELEEEWKNMTSKGDFSKVTDKDIRDAIQKEYYGK